VTIDQLFMLGLLVVVFALFVWGRWRYDMVAIAALLAATVGGAVPFNDVFEGFGHPATVTVAVVLIVSRGLQNAGAVDLIAKYLLPPLESTSRHVGLISMIGGVLSSVMNNVGALALLMPAAIQSAAKAKRSPAAILMPLSFASILGGLVTLIGTPPNIIVAAFRADAVGAPFGMFDFTPVGGVVALVGVAFVALVGWRLIPGSRRAHSTPEELFEIEGYVSEATVPEGSPAIDEILTDLDDKVDEHGVVIMGLVRNDRRVDRAGRREKIRAGDILILEASPEALDTVLADLKLEKVGRGAEDSEDGKRMTMSLTEAVVQHQSRIVGRTAASLRLRRRYSVNLIAVARAGEEFHGRLRSFRFRAGDVLLLEGQEERLPELVAALGCLPLAPRGLSIGEPRRAGLAIGLFAVMILCATLGWLSMPVALAIAALGMVLLDIVSPREIYDSIDWPIVVLLGAMIPIGAAFQDSGTAGLIAQTLVGLVAGFGPAVVLGLVLVLTMTLSDVINNAATAVVMGPVALSVATKLGVAADPFLMAVAVGASCAFLTPIGHQNNMLVMGPGGYHFGDYWRLGLPLEVLIVAVALPMILIVWPL
jgi:di/tricarboxylate transporter